MTATLTEPTAPRPVKSRRRPPAARKLFDPAITKQAIKDSFVKLNPRTMVRNPVMFVVEVGSVLTTILFFRDIGSSTANENVFAGLVALWLWFTVLFANFAEAMAEGRGKAQAATLRKTRAETMARVRQPDGSLVEKPSTALQLGDLCVVAAGELIPGDGDVVEGVATVDESAITGESAPVIRESGGDRSAVTGGTRVLSDEITVKITSKPGETFLDRMIALVEGANRQKTPNEIALDDPARRAHDHLPAGRRHAPAVRHLLGRRAVDHRPRRAAGLPDPDDHRSVAVGHRHRRHGPARAAQRARHERPGRRGGRRREHAAARQDRHHHVRLPSGGRVRPRARRGRARPRRGGHALEPG